MTYAPETVCSKGVYQILSGKLTRSGPTAVGYEVDSHPVVYLRSGVEISGGKGTYDEPYTLSYDISKMPTCSVVSTGTSMSNPMPISIKCVDDTGFNTINQISADATQNNWSTGGNRIVTFNSTSVSTSGNTLTINGNLTTETYWYGCPGAKIVFPEGFVSDNSGNLSLPFETSGNIDFYCDARGVT